MPGLRDMLGGSLADTFLGLPAGQAGDIVLFGADCATPYASVGPYCAGGPGAIRAGSADYAGALGRINFDLGGPLLSAGVRAVDAGDLAVDPGDPVGNRALIRDRTAAVLAGGGVPVVLGGDDSVPIPVLEAYAGAGLLTILQIDAHIDWRDEVDGERLGLSSTMRRASEMAHVDRIVQVGARGVGSADATALEAARAYGAEIVPAIEIGAGHAMQDGLARAISLVPDGAAVYIAFDCDALDPSIMPAVIAPTAGGLSYREALHLIAGVAAKARIVGFDMVEFMPDADTQGIGARTAAQLLTSVLGLIGRQRTA